MRGAAGDSPGAEGQLCHTDQHRVGGDPKRGEGGEDPKGSVGIRRKEINRENIRKLEQDGEGGGVQSQSKEVKIRYRRQTTEQMKTGESSQI